MPRGGQTGLITKAFMQWLKLFRQGRKERFFRF
jgi:hypothetical protein